MWLMICQRSSGIPSNYLRLLVSPTTGVQCLPPCLLHLYKLQSIHLRCLSLPVITLCLKSQSFVHLFMLLTCKLSFTLKLVFLLSLLPAIPLLLTPCNSSMKTTITIRSNTLIFLTPTFVLLALFFPWVGLSAGSAQNVLYGRRDTSRSRPRSFWGIVEDWRE